jgi:hypothetical protein
MNDCDESRSRFPVITLKGIAKSASATMPPHARGNVAVGRSSVLAVMLVVLMTPAPIRAPLFSALVFIRDV